MSEETEEPAQEKYDETQERDIFSGEKKIYFFAARRQNLGRRIKYDIGG